MGGELASPEFRFAAKIAPRLGELGVHSLITYDNLYLSYVIKQPRKRRLLATNCTLGAVYKCSSVRNDNSTMRSSN